MTTQRSTLFNTTAIVALVSLALVLMADRIYVAQQLENLRTRVMRTEADLRDTNELIARFRTRQIENEDRITRLESGRR